MSLRSSPIKKTSIRYKYDEQNILNGVYAYIQDTYKEHYSKNNYQATEFIIDAGHGTSFCIGNIMKYAMRYGKKNGSNVNDLFKIIHYAMIAIHIYDEEQDGRD